MTFTSFEDMNVWKIAMNVATSVFDIAITLPRSENYRLNGRNVNYFNENEVEVITNKNDTTIYELNKIIKVLKPQS